MNVLHLATGLTMLFEFFVGWKVLKWLEKKEIEEWNDYNTRN